MCRGGGLVLLRPALLAAEACGKDVRHPEPCDARHVPRVNLISDFDRAFHPHADPRNVVMIRRRHALWTELVHLHGWDLALRDVAALDATPSGIRGSTCWIDLPMLPRAREPMVLELNPLYAAGYNVPAAHALLAAALGAHLASRAGYTESTRDEILASASALAGERIEENPAVWLFEPPPGLAGPV